VSENDEAAAQERDVDRLVAFSDGVYAIAITLLVLSLSVPDGPDSKLGEELRNLGPQLLSYALSFAVIGRYWVAHHRLFRSLRRVDGTLLGINLALLGFIALLPFPTQVLGDYGDTTLGTVIYAVTICAVGSLTALIAWYIAHADLSAPTPPSVVRARIVHGMVVVVVFAISIPIAFASPAVAKYSWLLMIPFGIVAGRYTGPDDA
jgi:TMEM175 potassium channel family protein